MKQGGGQPNLNTGIVKEISFVHPTSDEQQKIVEFIKTEISKFSDLRAKAESAIALLKERRSALITAAVTGQIDVRN